MSVLSMAGAAAQPVGGAQLLADSDTGKGSPIGFFVVLVLVIAVYFLYRSMNRHLKNVPDSFDPVGQVRVAEPTEPGAPTALAEPTEPAGPTAEPDVDEAARPGAVPVTPREPGPDRP